MKRYDEKMLNLLLNRYEGSLLYAGKNQVHISISVPVSKKHFPEYFVEGSLEFDVFHEQMEALERKGFLQLVWKNQKQGHILEKCVLCTEQTEEVYKMLRRTPKYEKENKILQLCQNYQGKSQELDCFLLWIENRIKNKESIRKYIELGDAERFERLCQLIWHITANKAEIFLRNFSVLWFHDSKLAEKDIYLAVGIIQAFQQENIFENMEADEILEEYNIFRNPSWIMMKGYGNFVVSQNNRETTVDLQSMEAGIGIANQDVPHIHWNTDCAPKKVITIENLTSFHQWNRSMEEEMTLCVYLGGYHNHTKREFLMNLYEVFPDVLYYHFGDIDCGGFRIWKNLCVKTGIPSKLYRMDIETYRKYLPFGKELTGNDRKTLENMQKDSFFQEQKELFEQMLRENKKIEQECINALTL